MPRRTLDVFEKHQLRIARQTLRMSDVMVSVMGGPTLAESRRIVARLGSPRERVAIVRAIKDENPSEPDAAVTRALTGEEI